MPQKSHIMHGRDHCPDGADPIPCLPPGLGGVPIEYGDYITSLGPIAYWRLGETGSPWADTSGYAGGPRNLTIQGDGDIEPLTPDVTGALPAGQDDGAVLFNDVGGGIGGTGDEGQYLQSPGELSFWSLTDMTVTAFVKVAATTNPGRGHIVGNQEWAVAGSGFLIGWRLFVLASHQLCFSRGSGSGGTPEPLAATPGYLLEDEWYHVAATYDSADMKLYINGNLVATTAEPSGTAAGTSGQAVTVGYNTGGGPGGTIHWFSGSVDEVAIWNTALAGDEIAAMASVLTDADAVAVGKVLTSDGAGGSSWEYVTTGGIVDGAVTPAKIEPGTDGYVMTSTSGAAGWALPTLRVNY